MINDSAIKEVVISGQNLTVEQVVAVARYNAVVRLLPTNIVNIQKNWDALNQMMDDGQVMYGTNTGIGAFGNVILPKEQTIELSYRMVRAHASAVGEPAPLEICRAALVLRLNVLVKGYSGIRPIIAETIVAMLNKQVTPVIYDKGSVGTSGDLAPLSQMALVVFGEGEAWYKGERLPGLEAMTKAGIEPVKLMYREGLALINGTQFMTAYGCINLYEAQRLIKNSEISAAMTIDALNCVELAYDKRYQDVRPFQGQSDSAENLRLLLKGSEILKQPKLNIQNAYSLRCTPQVLGACRDTMDYARRQLEIEINACVDNPIYLTDEKVCLTGGNFHGEPIGFVMDFLGIAMSEVANISERRTNNLLDPALSGGLPAFLVGGQGLNSGLMIAQYSQAALVSENKILASPASVDSIPVSANQEDHVSMGTIAARKCLEIIKNAQQVIAIEYLVAAQAFEWRLPLSPSLANSSAYQVVRSVSPKIEDDRPYYVDIESVTKIVRDYSVIIAVEKSVGILK
ncbi:MAG: histidine ammonia-lyase [Candidatus Magasanikbacteria bacterium]